MIKWIADHFQHIQISLLVFFAILVVMALRKQSPKSNFKLREADRKDRAQTQAQSDLANARLRKFTPPSSPKGPTLQLPGINLSGAPHEILGIAEGASEPEILKAYKECIKRYHPDRIQSVPTDQVDFYKNAAIAINSAKEEMLKRLKS